MVNGIMGGPGDYIPAVGATDADGAMLLDLLADSDDDITVTFTDGTIEEPNPNAGFISDFSSWGLTPDFQLKPDVTGPGGNIRSTYPLSMGGYAYLSGASMSSPHVAGAAAQIKAGGTGVNCQPPRGRGGSPPPAGPARTERR